jgi:tetratricopeptide (TPR) repeat protein
LNYRIGLSLGLLVVVCLGIMVWRLIIRERRDVNEGFVRRIMERKGASSALLRPYVERCPPSRLVQSSWCQVAIDEHGAASEEAERRILNFHEMFPSNDHACKLHARIYSERGEFAKAELVLREGLKRRGHGPSRLWLYSDYAGLAERQNNWDEAVFRWQSAQAVFGDRPEAFLGEARIRRRQKSLGAALECALKAFEIAQQSEPVLRLCGELFEETADWPNAIIVWTRFKEAFDTKPDGYVRSAAGLRRIGDISGAANIMESAVVIFPSDPGIIAENAQIAALGSSRTGQSRE